MPSSRRKTNAEPLCGFTRKPCLKERCVQWVHIRGKNPQTGAEIDMPDCALKWLPVLLIENAQEVRQAAAAVESSRNATITLVEGLGNGLRQIALERTRPLRAVKG